MSEAPGLVIEKQRLAAIGGAFLGIIGDSSHTFGYHLERPAPGDYSLVGPANTPVGPFACALDLGMGWPASREWLAWLIGEIRADRITGIAEVIGSLDGQNARYWSDSSGWHENGVAYEGAGHDTWTHVAVYRSTAMQDHRILAGWTATSGPAARRQEGDDMQSLMRCAGHPAVFLTDGRVARWVTSAAEIADLRTLGAEGTISLGHGGQIRDVGRRELIGVIVGPVPDGWADLTAVTPPTGGVDREWLAANLGAAILTRMAEADQASAEVLGGKS